MSVTTTMQASTPALTAVIARRAAPADELKVSPEVRV